MTRVMVIVGSVRPGRIGLGIAKWVRAAAEQCEGVEVDWADLAEINLPLLDEPVSPYSREYSKPHTFEWSARVDNAEAFILVAPEYNAGYSPALKNALDFVFHEWAHKPVSFVSYGQVAGGTRGAALLGPVLQNLGLVRTLNNLAIYNLTDRIVDGVFVPSDLESAQLGATLNELLSLADALKSTR